MGFFQRVKEVLTGMFTAQAEKDFDIDVFTDMDGFIREAEAISMGKPPWETDEIKTRGLAQFINEYMAKLVCLNIDIKSDDEFLQQQADYLLANLQNNIAYALGSCGIMFKPTESGIDYVKSGDFKPVSYDSNGNILSCVFQSQIKKGKLIYTRLEYHRFEDDQYRISNRAYCSKGEGIGESCPLSSVEEWAGIEPDVSVGGLEKPLFAFFRNPMPNLKFDSPLGLPIWNNCLEELKDYDKAWALKSQEIEDSRHVTIVPQSAVSFAEEHGYKLPRFLLGLETGLDGEFKEHSATLRTEQRIQDINSILSVIAMKCGLSAGSFVFNEKTQVATATQIEADQQETIRTINALRESLEACLKQLFYGLASMKNLYEGSADDPAEKVEEILFTYGDITYSWEEDKQTYWKYVQAGVIPAWHYFVKFENMTEEEAQNLVKEARAENTVPDLFGGA